MSFLIDPFLLVLCGAVIVWLQNRLLYRATRYGKLVLQVVTVLGFWLVAGSLYLNLGWFDWIWIWLGRSASGRDFMINSGLFSFEYVNTAGLIDTLAVIMFALYPLWLYSGTFLGYLLFGRHERQTGIVGLL